MFFLRLQRLCAPLPPSVVATGVLDRLFQWLDLLGIGDLYEGISNALTPGLRRLTEAERQEVFPVFGRSIPYDRVRIDERAHLGPRRYRFCYVSFYTINSWGPIALPTLAHELVHVWQYHHHGAAYIPRALAAQHTAAGYNYGGLAGLRRAKCLLDFNYEQMADIIEDAYRIGCGYSAQWISGGGKATDLIHFQPYLHELRSAGPTTSV